MHFGFDYFLHCCSVLAVFWTKNTNIKNGSCGEFSLIRRHLNTKFQKIYQSVSKIICDKQTDKYESIGPFGLQLRSNKESTLNSSGTTMKMGSFEPLGFKVDFSDFRANLTIYHFSITHHIHLLPFI